MLSYRHGFHAGNFADVFKHVVLSLTLRSFLKKDKPFVYVDTHSGAGLYKLNAGLPNKTREYQDGVARIWMNSTVPEPVEPYLAAVRSVNSGDKLVWYPGSPRLARHFLRSVDRMELCELHSSEVPSLRSLFAGERRVHIHQEDGYQILKGLVPPLERRGVVLCDPAYELKEERNKVLAALTDAWQRWPTGTYAVWYPIMDRQPTDWLLRQFKRSGIKKVLLLELTVYRDRLPDRLNGTGMLLINPPWQVDEQMMRAGPWLAQTLAQEEGNFRLEWLVGE